ncbi:hypothetical protein OAN307_c17050 [Octadecabacter antarcticus 307]|uniref:YycE-like N-terminal domain-containing protein n=1 Tax=Octadecabacter antarcticus 307 TaxID=391626 RepID=M9R572_9RHOB|nr:hypothetical protein OAN307_c17050 [Octadecabacter antarcticus 307]
MKSTAPCATRSGPDRRHLRIACPSDDLDAFLVLYCDGLETDIIGHVSDHDGFHGQIFGTPNAPYNVEFTKSALRVGRAPTHENVAVFHLPDPNAWVTAVARIQTVGFDPAHHIIL